jgi:hypothetical protein
MFAEAEKSTWESFAFASTEAVALSSWSEPVDL